MNVGSGGAALGQGCVKQRNQVVPISEVGLRGGLHVMLLILPFCLLYLFYREGVRSSGLRVR